MAFIGEAAFDQRPPCNLAKGETGPEHSFDHRMTF